MYLVTKRKTVAPFRANMCMCVYQSVYLQRALYMRNLLGASAKEFPLALKHLRDAVLILRYQEQGAKLHFIRYRKTCFDCIPLLTH